MRNSLSGIVKLIRFLKDKDVSTGKKLLFLVPILYFILPFDLVGDFFPVLGQLDDIAVAVVMWPILKKFITSYYESPSSQRYDNSDGKTVDMDKDDYKVDRKLNNL